MQIFRWVCIVIEARVQLKNNWTKTICFCTSHITVMQIFVNNSEYRLSIKILIRFFNFSVLSYHAEALQRKIEFNVSSTVSFPSRVVTREL